MHRGFETSTRRRQRSLDGPWEFVTDPGNEGVDEEYFESFPSEDAEEIDVPRSWTARSDYADYVGPAWYRRTFDLPEATGLRVRFDAIGGAATVYLDGEQLTRTGDGATPVSALEPELEAGEHDLVVRVDNRPDQWTLAGAAGGAHASTAAVAQADADGVAHAGIHGAVVLEELPTIYVTDLSIDVEHEDGDALVEADVTLHSLGHLTRNRRLTVSVGDEDVAGIVPVAGRDASSMTLPVLLEDVDRWTPDDPTLYDVVVRVDPIEEVPAPDEGDDLQGDWEHVKGGDPTAEPDPDAAGDEVIERIGFREIGVDGREITLDGEPIEVAAISRQAVHPDWGAAQPADVQDLDVDRLLAAGVDAVRCPGVADSRFLDRCDEEGLLVIEGFGVGDVDAAVVEGGSTLQAVRKRVTGAIRRDRHHPSVIAWEIADRWPTTEPAVRNSVEQLAGLANGIDGTRPITLSSTADWGEERDRAFELCDVCSVADDRRGGPDGHDADDWSETLDRTANRYAEKPILVSSFAGAPQAAEGGAASDGEWAESAQADRIEELIGTFREDPAVAGFAVWQFADTPSDSSGVLTATRDPKAAFDRLASLLDDGDD